MLCLCQEIESIVQIRKVYHKLFMGIDLITTNKEECYFLFLQISSASSNNSFAVSLAFSIIR